MRVVLMALLSLLVNQAFGQVKDFTLNNGLKVLVKEDHRAPVAVVMVWYNVGSADEPGGLTGVTHALEHLMFKGTAKYPVGVFSKIIAKHGGQENAMTTNDYTAYYEKITASQLPTCFSLEADRMEHLLLNPVEFAKEMQVIQEERRLRTDDNPQALTFERFLATAHLAAPYHHPVIGWMSDIRHMQVSDAQVWYDRYYSPNNATLVVIGDVKAEEVHTLAETHFGKIAKRPLPIRKSQQEPPLLGKKSVTVKAKAQLPLLILGYTVPSLKTVSSQHLQDPYALEIISGILDAGEHARFSKNLIRTKQLASNTNIFYNLYSRYQTQFVIYGTPNQTHTLSELADGIQQELHRLQVEPVSEAELQRIKTQIIAQKTFEKDSIFSQAMEMGVLETVGLGWQTADQYITHIQQVTPLEIKQAAQRYFQEKNMTEASLLPIQPKASPNLPKRAS